MDTRGTHPMDMEVEEEEEGEPAEIPAAALIVTFRQILQEQMQGAVKGECSEAE